MLVPGIGLHIALVIHPSCLFMLHNAHFLVCSTSQAADPNADDKRNELQKETKHFLVTVCKYFSCIQKGVPMFAYRTKTSNHDAETFEVERLCF